MSLPGLSWIICAICLPPHTPKAPYCHQLHVVFVGSSIIVQRLDNLPFCRLQDIIHILHVYVCIPPPMPRSRGHEDFALDLLQYGGPQLAYACRRPLASLARAPWKRCKNGGGLVRREMEGTYMVKAICSTVSYLKTSQGIPDPHLIG